ncbi:protein NLP3-like [Glycine soja]|nr:protein NLP3-like [Glycine soja]
MSAFYDALCTGMDWTEVSNDVDDDLGPPNGTEQESESEPEAENGRRASTSRPRRRDMAVQRQRVPRMTLSDLSGVFHLTISAAAVKLDVGDSTVKSICRRGKLKRWPQRKVQSLAKKVRVLERALNSPDPGVKRRTLDEIRRLQQEIIENCGGITPTGIPMLQFDEE